MYSSAAVASGASHNVPAGGTAGGEEVGGPTTGGDAGGATELTPVTAGDFSGGGMGGMGGMGGGTGTRPGRDDD